MQRFSGKNTVSGTKWKLTSNLFCTSSSNTLTFQFFEELQVHLKAELREAYGSSQVGESGVEELEEPDDSDEIGGHGRDHLDRIHCPVRSSFHHVASRPARKRISNSSKHGKTPNSKRPSGILIKMLCEGRKTAQLTFFPCKRPFLFWCAILRSLGS